MYDGLNPNGKTIDVKSVLLGLLLKCDWFKDAHQLLDELLQPDGTILTNEMTLHVSFSILLRWDYDKECDKFVDLLPRVRTPFECVKKVLRDDLKKGALVVIGLFPDSVLLTMMVTKQCRGYKNDKAWELLCELMKFRKVEATQWKSTSNQSTTIMDLIASRWEELVGGKELMEAQIIGGKKLREKVDMRWKYKK
nr:hypothetical protein [Tanacetum cinerariifolium]